MSDNKEFNYTYYAPSESERREISEIRKQYAGESSGDVKIQKLRKLDSRVKNIPTAISLFLGILGVLVFGLGMSMILEWNIIFYGVAVCTAGLFPVFSAYPVYGLISKMMKKKYATEILRISEELLNFEK